MWLKKEGGGNWAILASLRNKTANQLCQTGTPIPTNFPQVGTPALHNSLLGHYISTKQSFRGLLSELSRRSGEAAYSWWGIKLWVTSILQSSDSRALKAKSMASLTGKCLISPFSKTIFWHSSKKNEVSWFLDNTKFYREHDKKLSLTEVRFFFLFRSALAITSQLCRSQGCWKSNGAKKTFVD